MTERDPLVLLQEALDDAETHQFLAASRDRWPRLDGARVADVLEMTTSHDLFLGQTEPFFEAHPDELRGARGVTAVLHALIILGRELTVANAIRLLMRAGLIPAPAVPRLHWRRVVIGRAARGYSADGAELHYLVFLSPDGQYRLTRYPRNGQHTEDIMSAAASAAVVADRDEGQRLAALSEAGESLPEIGWFPAPRPVLDLRPGDQVHIFGKPGGEMHTFLHPIEPGGDTALADLPAIWRRAAARTGSAVSSALEGCAMVLERALAEAGESIPEIGWFPGHVRPGTQVHEVMTRHAGQLDLEAALRHATPEQVRLAVDTVWDPGQREELFRGLDSEPGSDPLA
jgi:hypothetical protein